MPSLKGHKPKIDWGKNKITFDSERCTTWCLDRKSTVYAIPEATAREDNLITRFSEIRRQGRKLQVKKLTWEARIPTKGSGEAAGHDLYAQEAKDSPSKGTSNNRNRNRDRPPAKTLWANSVLERITSQTRVNSKHGSYRCRLRKRSQSYPGQFRRTGLRSNPRRKNLSNLWWKKF